MNGSATEVAAALGVDPDRRKAVCGPAGARPTRRADDVLSADGRDLRDDPLISRKRTLRRLIPRRGGTVQYVDHVSARGVALYRATCESDLEGMVAKWRSSPYRPLAGGPTWLKIKNPGYSQARDRHELFDRRN